MTLVRENLWRLARSGQPIDASELAAALEEQAGELEPDYRTCLLMRDSLDALSRHWGRERLDRWLEASPAGEQLRTFQAQDLGAVGFPSLARRIMDATKSEVVLRFFRELGSRIRQPARLDVGGSIALILRGDLSRHTEDIHVVGELPATVRTEPGLLNELADAYGLRLAHFQSHYLPSGWERRVQSWGRFDRLDVFLVDACDVFVGKLFSARRKDRDDLRALTDRLEKQRIEARLREAAGPLRAEPSLAANASENWYILYGEPLPT